MSMTNGELGESTHNASLRPVVAAIDRGMSRLSTGMAKDGQSGIPALLASWAKLVEILALGPAPEMRACPVCRRGGLRVATRCGFCWTALPRLPADDIVQAADGFFDGG